MVGVRRRCPSKGALRYGAEEVQNFCAGGTRSPWHFLVSRLVIWESQLMEDALCWMSSASGAFGLALFGVGAVGVDCGEFPAALVIRSGDYHSFE
jgi:hypothetical protein